MRPITTDQLEALHDVATTRRIEAKRMAAMPPHALMQRAGQAVARLALALEPHARSIWVACGPGNNGGDGLVAARHLHQWAQSQGGTIQVLVTHWTGSDPEGGHLPADARSALLQARAAGVVFTDTPPPLFDLAIDAIFGIGQRRTPPAVLQAWLNLLQQTPQTVLCVDVPSQLDADTGALTNGTPESTTNCTVPTAPPLHATGARHTLALLTLKPGLFTAHGRDQAGRIWLDELGTDTEQTRPSAWLAGRPALRAQPGRRLHASHKGSFGDVAVIGGQDMTVDGAGMTGAAVMAARAALQAGAGRVFVGLLGSDDAGGAIKWDALYPELMFRRIDLMLSTTFMETTVLVCGCGGGSAISSVLSHALTGAPRLVLDADALNTIAQSPALQRALQQRHPLGWTTVLTPHPLEAARLLGCDTATVMADRLHAAQSLSDRFQVVCVLKGSGTVISAPGCAPFINPTGGPALATAGTGDVLAGMIGSALAQPGTDADLSVERVAQAVFQHGWLADTWDASGESLRAGLLAARVKPLD